MAIAREEELYGPIKNHYEQQGFQVKGEVLHCDLVAIHPETEQTYIIELKKTFTLALLLQGVERQRLNSHVVLVVERNRKKSGSVGQRFGDIGELCRKLGLGLMTVTFYKTKPPLVETICEPGDPPRRGNRMKQKKRLLVEFHERSGDYNIGGSSSRPRVTAYREQALRCAWALEQADGAPLAPRHIATAIGSSKAGSILRSNYYGWFARGEKRGTYLLLPSGYEALQLYKDVLSGWTEAVASLALEATETNETMETNERNAASNSQ